MNERIKDLRKFLKLTQQNFADRLGVKRNTVAQWEIGVNNLSDQVVRAICREFNVSEAWLRTGEGEMFVPKEEDALDELAKQYNLSDVDCVLVEKFLKLKPTERQAVIAYMKDVVSALNTKTTPAGNAGKNIHVPAAGSSQRGLQEMTREEMHAALDRQLDEEKEAAENVSGFGHGQSGRATG